MLGDINSVQGRAVVAVPLKSSVEGASSHVRFHSIYVGVGLWVVKEHCVWLRTDHGSIYLELLPEPDVAFARGGMVPRGNAACSCPERPGHVGQRMEEQIVERSCKELSAGHKLAEVVPILAITCRSDSES